MKTKAEGHSMNPEKCRHAACKLLHIDFPAGLSPSLLKEPQHLEVSMGKYYKD